MAHAAPGPVVESHPTRVRGLKHIVEALSHEAHLSHPTRVRGLKLFGGGRREGQGAGSHPTRVRGLKPLVRDEVGKALRRSHPTRVRGLKHPHHGLPDALVAVAPHAGAWIETGPCNAGFSTPTKSHPTRVRGLKLPKDLSKNTFGACRTPRGCVD